jgi:hypothetical protein
MAPGSRPTRPRRSEYALHAAARAASGSHTPAVSPTPCARMCVCVCACTHCSVRHRAEHVHHNFFDLWSSRVRDFKEFGVGHMMCEWVVRRRVPPPCPAKRVTLSQCAHSRVMPPPQTSSSCGGWQHSSCCWACWWRRQTQPSTWQAGKCAGLCWSGVAQHAQQLLCHAHGHTHVPPPPARYFERGNLELTTLGNFGRVAVAHNSDGRSTQPHTTAGVRARYMRRHCGKARRMLSCATHTCMHA